MKPMKHAGKIVGAHGTKLCCPTTAVNIAIPCDKRLISINTAEVLARDG